MSCMQGLGGLLYQELADAFMCVVSQCVDAPWLAGSWSCRAGQSCGICLQQLASGDAACPDDYTSGAMGTCDTAAIGELCEGDGECGTNTGADNCGGYDIYRRVSDGGKLRVRRLSIARVRSLSTGVARPTTGLMQKGC